ncbi:MAG: hypothetical protein M3081_10290 [Gemmatimonadota bacterium]|nr:hypothetical protein [Gemmatimonadota bacterium]
MATARTGISRIDQDTTRTHGFFVRLGYARTTKGAWKPKHQAFFGDASHGGKRGALKAAEQFLHSLTPPTRRRAK